MLLENFASRACDYGCSVMFSAVNHASDVYEQYISSFRERSESYNPTGAYVTDDNSMPK